MIYYFSGTRNSRYAAMRLASLMGDETRFIPQTDPSLQSMEKGSAIGFVFPVYAWGVPPIVLDFIDSLLQEMLSTMADKSSFVWCVATCGDETGMAVEMLGKALARHGITLSAAWSLIMPNVYVLLPGFGTDPKPLEEKKIREATQRLDAIAPMIKDRQTICDVHRGPIPRLKTAIVYPLFRRWGVDTRKWHFTDACIGCTKCASVCPVGNIKIVDAHPVWGNQCTSCCACFHACPANSVQYSSITSRMSQYTPPPPIA